MRICVVVRSLHINVTQNMCMLYTHLCKRLKAQCVAHCFMFFLQHEQASASVCISNVLYFFAFLLLLLFSLYIHTYNTLHDKRRLLRCALKMVTIGDIVLSPKCITFTMWSKTSDNLILHKRFAYNNISGAKAYDFCVGNRNIFPCPFPPNRNCKIKIEDRRRRRARKKLVLDKNSCSDICIPLSAHE